MTVTVDTPWRPGLAVDLATWTRTITNAGGRPELATAACYDAAGPYSGLCLAQLGEESAYDTSYDANPKSNANPLNLRPRGGDGFLKLFTIESGIREWRDRITSPTYAYKDTTTIADLIRVYAPSSDANDPAGYAAHVVARLNAWGVTPGGAIEVATEVVFGRVPKPKMVELICTKEPVPPGGLGHGYYNLVSPRTNVGVCEHITDGLGSIEFYSSFFSVGGERADDALVDYVIGRDGRIGHLNDETGHRAGWANGDTQGVEGDGAAFLAHFSGEVDAPNFHLISIEHEGPAQADWTSAQWNASVALDAWLFDRMGVRYDSFPVNQNIGIVTHLLHSEFTGKGGNLLDECPGRYLKRNIDAFQAAIKAVMMAHQVTDTQSSQYTAPKPLNWKRGDAGPIKYGDVVVQRCVFEVTCASAKGAQPKAWVGGPASGPRINQGEKRVAIGNYRNEKGTEYLFLDDGSRVMGSNFKPRLPKP